MGDPNTYWLSTLMAPERFFLNLASPPFQDWSESFSPLHLVESQMEVFIANTLNLYYMPLFFMSFLLPEQQETQEKISNLGKRAASSKKRVRNNHAKVIRVGKS